MSSLGSPSTLFLAKKKAYEVERSLRFNYSDSPQLKRTGSSTSSSYTVSMWFKYTGVGKNEFNLLFSLGQSNDANSAFMGINNNDKFIVYNNGGYQFTSTRVYRDPSAWYHFTMSVNSNSYTLYINNESIDTGTLRSLDTSSDGLRIGIQYSNYYPFNGYIADFYLIDGYALTPSSFTETNILTGQLVPKKYTGSFGTSGAHLLFDDNSGTTATTLGKDSSGNGNNFTPYNFSVSDSVKDTPTNNFCTLNPLYKSTGVSAVSEGNLKVAFTGSGSGTITSTFAPSSGKWYAEQLCVTVGNGTAIGVYGKNVDVNAWISLVDGIAYYPGGFVVNSSLSGSAATYADGDILGIALDITNGDVEFFKNNSSVGTKNLSDMASNNNYFIGFSDGSTGTLGAGFMNYGQDSSFAGAKTAQGNTDANGLGDFYYAPPNGFLALCSANLPDPTILLPNKHFDTVLYTGTGATQSISSLNFGPDWIWLKRRDSAHSHGLFDSVRGPNKLLYSDLTDSENQYGSLQSFNSDGFTLTTGGEGNTSSASYVAWNWNGGDTDGKTYTVTVVSDSGNKYRFDGFGTSAVTLDLAEGGTYIFNYPAAHPFRFSTTADGTHGGGTEYTTGVTVLSSTSIQIVVAASAPNLNYYCSSHSGMGGAINTNSTLGSSNFDGDAQTTVKVSTTAGFSIVTFTDNYPAGTGTYGLGHGLGVKPAFYVVKSRNHANAWWTWHQEYSNQAQGYQFLNATNVLANSVTPWGNSAPDSTKFYIKEGGFNYVDDTFVAYCFSEVAGYSKFGKYTGNGNANGPFVFTSFKPAVIILKNTSTAEDWAIRDIKHSGYTTMNGNPVNIGLRPNTNAGYTGGSNLGMDFLSNGFKLRGPDSDVNKSGDTYIYLAFASSPFKNARAR